MCIYQVVYVLRTKAAFNVKGTFVYIIVGRFIVHKKKLHLTFLKHYVNLKRVQIDLQKELVQKKDQVQALTAEQGSKQCYSS